MTSCLFAEFPMYYYVCVLGEESCIPPVITYESKEQLLVSISMLASIVYS